MKKVILLGLMLGSLVLLIPLDSLDSLVHLTLSDDSVKVVLGGNIFSLRLGICYDLK